MTGQAKQFQPLLLIWLVVALVLITVSWPVISSGLGWGPDDQLRQVQLRDWLAGQSWFDTVQYRIGEPDSQPMHWPRLIELPLALIVLMLTPIIGGSAAETAAMVVVPLLNLLLVMLLVAHISEKLLNRRTALLAAALTATAIPVIAQLRPMRIDHHGWQVALALLALATLFWARDRRAGLVLGATLALWLSISLEGLPLAAAFFAYLGWRWAILLEEGKRLFWAVVSLAGGTLLFYLLNHGSFSLLNAYCDAIAPGHVLAIGAAAAVMIPASHYLPAQRPLRLAAGLLAGVAAISVFYSVAPVCWGSAFGQMDPIVQDYWLASVKEGLPLWKQGWRENMTLLGGALGVGFFISLAWLIHPPAGVARDRLHVLIYAFFAACAVSLYVQRAAAVAAVYALPMLAWAVETAFNRARQIDRPVQRILATVAVIFIILPGPLFLSVIDMVSPPVEDQDKPAAELPMCGTAASLRRLNALPPSYVMAPFDYGPLILVQTPHRVLATSHHRNDGAMAAQIRIFSAQAERSRKLLEERQIRYIAACSDNPEMQLYLRKHPEGFWAQLVAGKKPDWLQPVHLRDSNLQLWRIVPKE